MARFLFTAWHFPGHYFPLIPIAHALQSRGHDVSFLASPVAIPVLEEQGFTCFPFRALDTEAVDAFMFTEERGSWLGLRDAFRLRTAMRRWLVDTLPDQVTDLEAVLREWSPDVITTDPTYWGPMVIIHEKHDIPVAVASFVPACMVPTPEVPLFGAGLPPVRNLRTFLLAHTVAALGNRLSQEVRRTVNQHRIGHGLEPLEVSVTEFTGTLPLYLVPSVPEFDYHRTELPPSVHYVGPCVWNRPGHAAGAGPDLDALPHDQPWVHVTEGTVHIREPFLLDAAVRGLGRQPMTVVLTTGHNRDPNAVLLDHPPDNIHVFDYISHSELLPHLDVLVTTGGAGTTLAALQAGVPLIMVPTETDKPENAQRVVEAGAGIRLSPARCTPRRLREAVEEVLTHPSYRENAQRLQRVFAQYGGPATAADLLETLARERA